MSLVPLQSLVEKLTELPTLPSVVTKISSLMQNPRTSASEIGQAISTDQSLASKTLKLVNSAFYGFPGRINTITHAIVILGFTTVKNIVLTTSIFNALGKKSENSRFNLEQFWYHSIATGAIAKILANHYHMKNSEEAFIGGLLHDLGKVVLHHYASTEFEKILDVRDEKSCLLKEAEEQILSISHQEVGGWLAEKWNLPKDLAAVMRYHHQPESSGSYHDLTALIHVADILARSLGVGSGGDQGVPVISPSVWQSMKLNDLNFSRLLSQAEGEIEKATFFLQVM